MKDFQQSNRDPQLLSDINSKQYPPRQDPRQYGQGVIPNQSPGSPDFRPYAPVQDPKKYPPRPDLNQKPVRQAPGPGQYPNQPNKNFDLVGSKQSQYPSRPDSNQQPGELPNNSKDNLGLKSMNQYPGNPPLPAGSGSNFYPPPQSNPYPSRQKNEAKLPGAPSQNYPDPKAGQNMNPSGYLNTQKKQIREVPENPGPLNGLPPKASVLKDLLYEVPPGVPPSPNHVDPGMPPAPDAAPPDRASQPLNVPGVGPGGLDQANMDRPPVAPPNPVQVDKPDLDADQKSRILGKISPKSNPQNSPNPLDQNGR